MSLSGGYKVQPVPPPASETVDKFIKKKDGINNQKLKLLIRANDISGAPIIIGINQFPNPPIITGIIKKKIINKA
jgi:hypothetical protein